MDPSRSAGIKFHISAGVPSTFDQAGYEALTFTQVKGIERLSAFGATWNIEDFNPLDITGTRRLKTNRDPGVISFDAALDTDDPGQVLVKAARESTALYAIKIEFPNGDDYYAQVLVSNFQPNPDTQSAKQMATANMSVSTSETDVDWVEVLAA